MNQLDTKGVPLHSGLIFQPLLELVNSDSHEWTCPLRPRFNHESFWDESFTGKMMSGGVKDKGGGDREVHSFTYNLHCLVTPRPTLVPDPTSPHHLSSLRQFQGQETTKNWSTDILSNAVGSHTPRGRLAHQQKNG